MSTVSTARADIAERRRRYLAAAQELFAEHGYAGTTMDMLVGEVGGSKATLYQYFPSKEALVRGLMDEVASSISGSTVELVDADVPLEAALSRIGRAALDGVLGPRATTLFRLSLGEYGRFPELARVVWEKGPAVTYADFRRFLDERQRRGEVRVEDTQLAAEQFIAGLVGHLQPKVAMGIAEPPGPAESDRRVASAVRTFLARYAVPGSDTGG